jgi:hypothetical protein
MRHVNFYLLRKVLKLLNFSHISKFEILGCDKSMVQSMSKNNPDPSQKICSFKPSLDWISMVWFFFFDLGSVGLKTTGPNIGKNSQP